MKKKGNMVASKTPSLAADIPGVQVLKDAKKKGSGFKTGGAVAKKDGGVAEGMKTGGRMDKAPRMASGGSMRGRSPFSHASNVSPPHSGGKSNGY